MGKAINIAGQQFGRLKALIPSNKRTPGGGKFWVCQCECGTQCEKSQSALSSGHVTSCGCARRGPKAARSMPAVRNYLLMHGPASVSQIARVTHLSRPTVHKMVKQLHAVQAAYIVSWVDSRTPQFDWWSDVQTAPPADAPRPAALTGSQRVARYRKNRRGTFNCPICGKDFPHEHPGAEVAAYQIAIRSKASLASAPIATPESVVCHNESSPATDSPPRTDWSAIFGDSDE